jgi:hypothetical protein
MDHQATEALRVQSHQLAHAYHGNPLSGGPLPLSITAAGLAEGVSGFCRPFVLAMVVIPLGAAVRLGKRAVTVSSEIPQSGARFARG